MRTLVYGAGMLSSRFAQIAYAQHAAAAPDEMRCLAEEFRVLIDRTLLATPSIDELRRAT